MNHKYYHHYLTVNLLSQGRFGLRATSNQNTKETDLHIKEKQIEEPFLIWPCDISAHPLFSAGLHLWV